MKIRSQWPDYRFSPFGKRTRYGQAGRGLQFLTTFSIIRTVRTRVVSKMLLCCRKADTAAFWLILSAALAAGAFVICAASSSPEETTISVTSLESPDSYLSKEEIDIEAEKETPAGTGEKLVIGDLEKLKKVAEILQTVGETVIPVLIQNNAPSNSESESIQNKTRGLQLIHGLQKEVNELAKTKS